MSASEKDTTMLPTADARGEVADVIRAVLSVPQLTLERGWTLAQRNDHWAVIIATAELDPDDEQPHLLGCAGAIEHVVVALQAHGRRVRVDPFPAAEPTTVATIRVIGPGPSTAVDRALLAACQVPPVRPPGPPTIRPSDLRMLNLTLEAFGVEALWSSDLAARRDLKGLQHVSSGGANRPMATLVTPQDAPHDWLEAGRALAHLVLRATTLGLVSRLDVHALHHRRTREALRAAWGLERYPQVQFTIETTIEPTIEPARDQTNEE